MFKIPSAATCAPVENCLYIGILMNILAYCFALHTQLMLTNMNNNYTQPMHIHSIKRTPHILDGRCDIYLVSHSTDSFKGKEILDNLIAECSRNLVNNWSNIDTFPGCMPFLMQKVYLRTLALSHKKENLGAYHVSTHAYMYTLSLTHTHTHTHTRNIHTLTST